MSMRKDPVHRAEVLKLYANPADIFRPKTDSELREIARRLGIEDKLPDPQEELPLQVMQ